eukprot:394302_1
MESKDKKKATHYGDPNLDEMTKIVGNALKSAIPETAESVNRLQWQCPKCRISLGDLPFGNQCEVCKRVQEMALIWMCEVDQLEEETEKKMSKSMELQRTHLKNITRARSLLNLQLQRTVELKKKVQASVELEESLSAAIMKNKHLIQITEDEVTQFTDNIGLKLQLIHNRFRKSVQLSNNIGLKLQNLSMQTKQYYPSEKIYLGNIFKWFEEKHYGFVRGKHGALIDVKFGQDVMQCTITEDDMKHTDADCTGLMKDYISGVKIGQPILFQTGKNMIRPDSFEVISIETGVKSNSEWIKRKECCKCRVHRRESNEGMRQQYRSDAESNEGKQPCSYWNSGHCSETFCQDLHCCSTCLSRKHTFRECCMSVEKQLDADLDTFGR